jgi:hypothetical protein
MNKHAACLIACSGVMSLWAGHDGEQPNGSSARRMPDTSAERALNAFAEQGPADARPEYLAWDCVPTYWWGYWTWAWQPCAWLDPVYVEGTIGAIAQVTPARSDVRRP